MENYEPPVIAPTGPEGVEETLRLTLAEQPADERAQTVRALLDEVRRGRASLAGLLDARRRGRLVGGIFSQIEPGRTAVVWPPRLVPDEPRATAHALLAATCRRLAEETVAAAHVLLPTVTADDDAVLRDGGFEPLVRLFYLVSPCESFPVSQPSGPLVFEAYCEERHARFARVVEATYVDSRDCPAMDGLRQIDDVLAGHRATGEFSPDRWMIVRHEGEDVGCLLLADHPLQENLELVYMGVVPSARGCGWGAQIARHAQWTARTLGRKRLVLAVDTANAPALEAYGRVGFEIWQEREVYFKRFLTPT